MKSFTMYIEKPMSYHERMYRKEGHSAADIDALVKSMVRKGFIVAGDPDAREMACVVEMAKIGARRYLD